MCISKLLLGTILFQNVRLETFVRGKYGVMVKSRAVLFLLLFDCVIFGKFLYFFMLQFH